MGALPVLAALDSLGGASGAYAFQKADPAAAICLANGLMQAVDDARRRWLPSNIRSHVEQVFADLASALNLQTVGTSFCNLEVSSEVCLATLRRSQLQFQRTSQKHVQPSGSGPQQLAASTSFRGSNYEYTKLVSLKS